MYYATIKCSWYNECWKKTVVNCVYEADKHVAKGSDIEIEFMSGKSGK